MDETDFRALAGLHRACLPDSTIGAFGPGYLSAFYRYVSRSPAERLVVERRHGRIVAGAVVSLKPDTLQRRLLISTPLLVALARHPLTAARLLRTITGSPKDEAGDARPMPELILLYTAESERGRGAGTAVIAGVERGLLAAGTRHYTVKTVLDAGNPALAFYRNRGFVEAGTVLELGRRFQRFTRVVP